MIVTLQMKCPDARHQALLEATEGVMDIEERQTITDIVSIALARYLVWGEYITVEIDTDTGNATVLPVRK